MSQSTNKSLLPAPPPPISSLPSSSTSSSEFDLSSELYAIISATISGAKYGVKIRFPHAFVMTFLFRKGTTLEEKLRIIVKATFEHSRNLASFATVYKLILCFLKWTSLQLRKEDEIEYRKHVISRVGNKIASLLVDGPFHQGRRLIPRPAGIPEKPQHAAIAGFIGGYTIWGNYSSINYQIVLYLTSRILTALVTLASEKYKTIPPFCWKQIKRKNGFYPYNAAIVWSIVMILFETNPEVLHPSLKRSMDEIYRMNLFKSWNKKGDGR